MELLNKENLFLIFFYIIMISLLYFLWFLIKNLLISKVIEKNGLQFAVGYFLKNFGIVFIVLKLIFYLSLVYFTKYERNVNMWGKHTFGDLYLIIFGISPIIIWLLIRIIESQNFIIANIRFKIGDQYFFEYFINQGYGENGKLFIIDSINDGNIHFSNLTYPDGFKIPITEFIKKLDEGIITKKV